MLGAVVVLGEERSLFTDQKQAAFGNFHCRAGVLCRLFSRSGSFSPPSNQVMVTGPRPLRAPKRVRMIDQTG